MLCIVTVNKRKQMDKHKEAMITFSVKHVASLKESQTPKIDCDQRIGHPSSNQSERF